MRKTKLVLLVAAAVLLHCGKSYAYTLPVFDYSALAEQIIHYATQLQQYYTQTEQYSTQLKQLETMNTNLRNLNYRSNLSNMDEMQEIMNSAIGISNRFTRMQRQFNDYYPEFEHYQQQNGVDYARQSQEWSKVAQKNAYDMLVVTSKLRESMEQDQNNLKYLNERSSAASGTKDLLQAMNQILIVNTKQLMQLQQLMGASVKAQAAFLAEKSSNDEALRADSNRLYDDFTKKGQRTPAARPGHVLQR